MGWSDEAAKDFKSWLSEHSGSMMCACDHGCNQWLKKNESKASLAMRIMFNKGTASLDKLVQRSNEDVNKIWYWLEMRENKKYNEEIRRQEREEGKKILERVPWEKVQAAWLPKWEEGQPSPTERRTEAAKALGLTRSELTLAYFAGKSENENE